MEDKRITLPFLTKYEKARVLGERAQQISLGSPVEIATSSTDPLEIARKELFLKKIPLSIKRYLPDGTVEIWNVNEMNLSYH